MPAKDAPLDPELVLPATLLSRYLFFVGRRPISAANAHYRGSRIGALQSLAPLFEAPEICEPLRALTPANLFRVGPRLQSVLQPRLAYRMPRDLVVTAHSPSPEFWSAIERMVVIYGPAIGIGDEIVAASVPRALQALAPDASIELLTAYDGLWDRIDPSQRVTRYADLAALLRRIREGSDDAIVYVDFEPPGLIAAIAHEPAVKRFIELSVGTRQVTLLDNVARRMHQMTAPHRENFYDAVREMCAWLGAEVPRPGADVPRPGAEAPRRRMRASRDAARLIVVSPFTSKEEPSERLWRNVLTSMVSGENDARVVIDTGPNAATRAFAVAIRDALRAFGSRCELAANGRAATLGEMLDRVRDADVVITADSYLAHAAPQFGAMTFVVARDGLEPWRVPSPSSFYFRSELDPIAIGAAMQQLVHEPRVSPRRSIEATTFRDAAAALDFDAPLESLLEAWQRCFDAHNALVATLTEWPRTFAMLVADERYSRLMPRVPRRAGISDAELRGHLADRFAECANSNLWKYVRESM
jgi:ADP-heptose:LPS heptosyltransferase